MASRALKAAPASTSQTECCCKSRVDRVTKRVTVTTRALEPHFPARRRERSRTMQMAAVLEIWMEGHTFAGGSMERRSPTSRHKTSPWGKGRRSARPVGSTAYKTRHTVMPVNMIKQRRR